VPYVYPFPSLVEASSRKSLGLLLQCNNRSGWLPTLERRRAIVHTAPALIHRAHFCKFASHTQRSFWPRHLVQAVLEPGPVLVRRADCGRVSRSIFSLLHRTGKAVRYSRLSLSLRELESDQAKMNERREYPRCSESWGGYSSAQL
jgi:hypothetical protein